MAGRSYTSRVNDYMLPFLQKNGFELIRTEFVSEDNNWYLRMFIDLSREEYEKRMAQMEAEKAEAAAELAATEGAELAILREVAEPDENDVNADEDGPEEPGVSINDCVKVSRYLSKWLDKEDFIKEAYTMEVCSRGFLNNEQTSEVEEGDNK